MELSADVNIRDKDGETALHYAAAHRDLDLMIKLINAGARLDLSDKYGNKPLDMMLCTREQADSFLAARAYVFTREDIRWSDNNAFLTDFAQRNMIHAPWNISPKLPHIITPPFVPEVTNHAAKEREKGIIVRLKERALTRALSEFHDYIPRSAGFSM